MGNISPRWDGPGRLMVSREPLKLDCGVVWCREGVWRSLSREPLESDLGVVWVCLGLIADLSDLGGLWCGGGVW